MGRRQDLLALVAGSKPTHGDSPCQTPRAAVPSLDSPRSRAKGCRPRPRGRRIRSRLLPASPGIRPSDNRSGCGGWHRPSHPPPAGRMAGRTGPSIPSHGTIFARRPLRIGTSRCFVPLRHFPWPVDRFEATPGSSQTNPHRGSGTEALALRPRRRVRELGFTRSAPSASRIVRDICFTLCSVLLAFSSARAGEYKPRWFHFEPSVVDLIGVVGVAYEYGPPNWSDDPKGAEGRQTPILRLSKPINILGDPTSDVNRGDAENVEEVQLELHRYRGLVGKRVVVTGTLRRSLTGWHFTEVVMVVKSIRKAPRLK